MTDLNCEVLGYYEIQKIIDDVMELQDICKKKGNYHQQGKDNNNYKDGISTYGQKKKARCEKCGSTKNLMVHHKDGNRSHNEAANLETLCWSCHEKITPRKRNAK